MIHIIFTLFWFTGSSAWANAVVRMKENTSPEFLIKNNEYLPQDLSAWNVNTESFVPLDFSIVSIFILIIAF